METKTICTNRKARHDYKILDSIEAGILLSGTEVKSLRAGHANLTDAYARIDDDEAWLVNASIQPYEMAGKYNHEPKRKRKLLLNKREIRRLDRQIESKGVTLIPLKLYFKGSWVKVELGIAVGKRQYDKRASLAEKDAKREMDRARKEMRRAQ